MRLTGKTALVTGASQGIGRATAISLAKKGANVWAVARSADDLAELQREQPDIQTYVADLTVLAQRKVLTETIGDIDILVNNAGIGVYRETEGMDEAHLRKMFELNFFAVVDLCQRFLPHMEGGHIVNVGSLAGFVAFSPIAFYSASKFALRAFTEGLRMDGSEYGVSVSYIAPGPVRTGFRNKAMTGDDRDSSETRSSGTTPQAVARAIVRSIRRRSIPGYQTIAVPRSSGYTRLAALPGLARLVPYASASYRARAKHATE